MWRTLQLASAEQTLPTLWSWDSNEGAWRSRSSSAALFMRRFSRPFRGAPASAADRGEQQAAGAGASAPAAQAPPATGTLDQRFWSCPGDGGFRLRGKTYMQARGACCRPRSGWQGGVPASHGLASAQALPHGCLACHFPPCQGMHFAAAELKKLRPTIYTGLFSQSSGSKRSRSSSCAAGVGPELSSSRTPAAAAASASGVAMV